MGKYTIKINYGKRCENFHKQQGWSVDLEHEKSQESEE